MISVVIPTFNEKENIKKILVMLQEIKIISEIIFVDDQSNDGTFIEIKKFQNYYIKGYLRKAKKKDLSKSVLYGVKKSKHKDILVMDCDLQHDPKYIIKMWNNYCNNSYDIVIANRFQNQKIIGNLGYFRSLISLSTINLINLIFGKKSFDPLSGFFLCKKNIILEYKKNFFSTGYKILFDIIYNGKNDLRIGHQNIKFNRRKYAESKFNFTIIGLFIKQMIYTIFLVKK